MEYQRLLFQIGIQIFWAIFGRHYGENLAPSCYFLPLVTHKLMTNWGCQPYSIYNAKSCAKKEPKNVGRMSSTCRICLQQGSPLYYNFLSFWNCLWFQTTYSHGSFTLTIAVRVDLDAAKRSKLIKKLHAETWKNIETKTIQYAKQANKGKKQVLF